MDGWDELRNAVVYQAVKDYRRAKNRKDLHSRRMKVDCEWFFRSSHFNLFCDLDGEELLHRLEKEGKHGSRKKLREPDQDAPE